MAKLVKVRYGLSNLSKEEYIYMVNDNVKRGSVLMPTVKHAVSGKVYTTMGVVQSSLNPRKKSTADEFESLKDKTNSQGEHVSIVQADKVSKQLTSALTPRDGNNKFIFEDKHGFGTKKSFYNYDENGEMKSVIGVGNEKYEAHKGEDAVRQARQSIASARTETDSNNLSFKDYFNTYMKGK